MFVNRLIATLELDLNGTKFSVPGGNIKNIDVELRPHGFRVSLDFWFICLKAQSEDKIFAKFVKDELAKAKLTIDRKFDAVGETADPIVLQGLVQRREVSERVFDALSGEPILHRHYSLDFADRAQVLWGQHYPTALYVDKKLTELIDANKPEGVKLTHSWAAGKVKHTVLSLPLGEELNEASFYDYLFWLLDRNHAGLYYDYVTDTYTISDKKKEFGNAVSLVADDVEELNAVFPPVSRSSVSVLNACTEAATKTKDIANKLKVTGVKNEYILRSSVASDLTDRATLETKRHKKSEVLARIDFGCFPSTTMRPNLLLKFDAWPSTIYQSKHQYRVLEIDIHASAESQMATDDAEDPSNAFEVVMVARLEKKENTLFAFPAYRVPVWPVQVEGKVLSELGDKPQETYQIYRNDKTSIDYYKVEVPLWKNQKVVVAFEPNLASGHFYFPIHKGARVLLELSHDRAEIHRFVQWRPGARLPQESQGNHILFGKTSKDQTSVNHVYKDAKPQLRIDRTSGEDKQVVEVSEGRIYMETIATK